MRAPPSQPNHLLNAPPPNPITERVRVSTEDYGETQTFSPGQQGKEESMNLGTNGGTVKIAGTQSPWEPSETVRSTPYSCPTEALGSWVFSLQFLLLVH